MPPSVTSTRDLPRSLLPAARLVGYTPHIASAYDARVSYALYIPAQHYHNDGRLPVVVALHGTTRQATPLLAAFQAVADATPCAVLAPLFPAGLNGPDDWDNYRVLRPGRTGEEEVVVVEQGSGARPSPPPLHADAVLLHVLDVEVPARWPGLRTDRVVLAGFSGGASAVQRLCLLWGGARVAAASIAAPGSTTRLLPRPSQKQNQQQDREKGGAGGEEGSRPLPWPAGLANFTDTFDGRRPAGPASLAQVAAWQLVVGSDDTALEGSLEGIVEAVREWRRDHPAGEEPADWEAVLRARMVSRRRLLEVFAEELGHEGVDVGPVEIVPGGRHALKDLAPAMARFLLEAIPTIGGGSCEGSA